MNGNENKVGRPTKLTREMFPEIIDLIKMGNYVETACAVEGINKTTYYYWLKKAHKSSESNIYTEFRDEVMKAKAWSEARDVAIISKASEKNWQAAAWKLERKYPNSWGRQKLEIEHPTKKKCRYITHSKDHQPKSKKSWTILQVNQRVQIQKKLKKRMISRLLYKILLILSRGYYGHFNITSTQINRCNKKNRR